MHASPIIEDYENAVGKVVAAVAVLALLLSFASHVQAQCVIGGPVVGTVGGSRVQVNKTVFFGTSVICNLTFATHTTMNGQPCWPLMTAVSSTAMGNFFARRQMTDIPTRACQWTCDDGCTIRIDQTDGLPVELMSFTVGDIEPEETHAD